MDGKAARPSGLIFRRIKSMFKKLDLSDSSLLMIESDKLKKIKKMASEQFPEIEDWTTTIVLFDDGSYELRRHHTKEDGQIAVVYFHGYVESYVRTEVETRGEI